MFKTILKIFRMIPQLALNTHLPNLYLVLLKKHLYEVCQSVSCTKISKISYILGEINSMFSNKKAVDF